MLELQWDPAGPGWAGPHQGATRVSGQELGKYLLSGTHPSSAEWQVVQQQCQEPQPCNGLIMQV